MSSRRDLIFVIYSVLLVQFTRSQCLGSLLSYAPEVSGGGGFTVRSSSPIAPSGVTVLSDKLVIEGPLVVDGQIPFLGTVALQGTLPAGGAGTVAHSCGGALGITSEIAPAYGANLVAPVGALSMGGPLGPGLNGLGSAISYSNLAPGSNRLGNWGPGVGPRGLY